MTEPQASAGQSEFLPPTPTEAFFNKIMGFFVRIGLGPKGIYLLQVRGRKSGKIYETPVSLVDVNGRRYLVAPRGRTQWVRNAEASGEVSLKRGSKVERFTLRPIAEPDRPEILKTYLDKYASVVQRYFTVKAGSPSLAFLPVAPKYPVFELVAG
jgi:deazaflavin-dependent oxidoreductase (nitroreductase family)